jgi:ElaB/YqjD/DUF883 family membrane-anchored ribosome-binding protein
MATNTTTGMTRETVGNVADRAKDTGAHMADMAKETAGQMVDKTKQMAGNLAGKAKDVTSTVAHKAEDLAKTAGQKADDATAYVGSGIRSAADTVRAKGPHDGMLGTATSSTAGALESTGRYLEEEKLSGMAGDVNQLIRKNPIPALFVAAGIGFLLGRMLRR